MSDEKPLRVQVAEALGWTDIVRETWPNPEQWGGAPPSWMEWPHEPDAEIAESEATLNPRARRIPPYGEDSPEGWACTGPLLERFGIQLRMCLYRGNVPCEWECSHASLGVELRPKAPTASEAIARCVVALAAAGKLPK